MVSEINSNTHTLAFQGPFLALRSTVNLCSFCVCSYLARKDQYGQIICPVIFLFTISWFILSRFQPFLPAKQSMNFLLFKVVYCKEFIGVLMLRQMQKRQWNNALCCRQGNANAIIWLQHWLKRVLEWILQNLSRACYISTKIWMQKVKRKFKCRNIYIYVFYVFLSQLIKHIYNIYYACIFVCKHTHTHTRSIFALNLQKKYLNLKYILNKYFLQIKLTYTYMHTYIIHTYSG